MNELEAYDVITGIDGKAKERGRAGKVPYTKAMRTKRATALKALHELKAEMGVECTQTDAMVDGDFDVIGDEN